MSLFDGNPLTEQEVALRALCACGHQYGSHHWRAVLTPGGCRWCKCEKFEDALRAQLRAEKEKL